jgi:hypothetical protein
MATRFRKGDRVAVVGNTALGENIEKVVGLKGTVAAFDEMYIGVRFPIGFSGHAIGGAAEKDSNGYWFLASELKLIRRRKVVKAATAKRTTSRKK